MKSPISICARLGPIFLLLAFAGCSEVRTSSDSNSSPGPAPSPAPTPGPVPGAEANRSSPLGANVARLAYFSTEWPLIDAFKTTNDWLTQCNGCPFDTGEQASIPRDAQGNVTALPAANDPVVRYRYLEKLIFRDTNGTYPAGDYVVLYEGEGTLEYDFDAQRVDALSQPGRHVVRVATPSDGGILLRLRATNPGNYVRNIRVILPGYLCNGDAFSYCADPRACTVSPGGTAACVPLEQVYGTQRFHPAFLANLRGFRLVRFMEMLRTNANLLARWDDRPQLSDATWAGPRGIPLEATAMLGNALAADIWIDMPVRVDDDYVRQAARLVRDSLASNLQVYLEHGNEVWNDAFPFSIDAAYVEQQANARWPNQADAFVRRLNWHGMRTRQICDIWKEEWGAQGAQGARVRCVMGSQAANSFVSRQALGCPLWVAEGNADCSRDMALAVAPYFGGYIGTEAMEAQVTQWTANADGGLAALFAELNGTARTQARGFINESASAARDFGVPLIAYEGGQHLVGVGRAEGDDTNNQLFLAGNRDARMGSLYRDHLDDWFAAGGQVFALFESISPYSRFGSWGLKESQRQAATPKSQAAADYAQAHPCGWTDCERP